MTQLVTPLSLKQDMEQKPSTAKQLAPNTFTPESHGQEKTEPGSPCTQHKQAYTHTHTHKRTHTHTQAHTHRHKRTHTHTQTHTSTHRQKRTHTHTHTHTSTHTTKPYSSTYTYGHHAHTGTFTFMSTPAHMYTLQIKQTNTEKHSDRLLQISTQDHKAHSQHMGPVCTAYF